MNSTSLTDALTARDAARAKLEAAVAAFERAHADDQAATAEVGRRAEEDSRWISRLVARREEWDAGGRKGAPPVATADAKAVQAQLSAKANAAATAQVLARRESAVRESRQALAIAEAAFDRAVRAALTAEGDREAAAILEDEAKLEARRNKLRGLRELVPPSAMVRRAAPVPGDWITTPIPELREMEASATGPGRLREHTPLNKLDTFEVDSRAVERWRKRLDDLLSGAGGPPSPASEERAA